MNRAAKLGLVTCAIAIGAVGFACSSSGSSGGDDAAPSTWSDASFDSAGFVLDARPGVPTDAPSSTGDAGAAPDTGASCAVSAGGTCGLDPQCGCSPSDTCDLGAGDIAACTTAGTGLAGHGCVTTASCAPGLTCITGACRAYCGSSGDAGCTDAGGACVGLLGEDGGLLPNVGVCTFYCALEDPSACGATGSIAAGCILDDPAAGTTDCVLVGTLGVDGDCSSASCAPGLVCVNFGGATPASLCRRWCRVGHAPDDCGDAAACQAFTTAVVAHGTEYGFCP